MTLTESQVMRWIDELNGISDVDEKVTDIKKQIRALRKESVTADNKKALRSLYANLDELLYKPDYLLLIIDRERDYKTACNGFTVNGISYTRLLGTNGGIKNSTIVFVSERLSVEIRKRIDNGRDLSKELVPAKFEAYRALTCSASIPISDPHGILVVNDCETSFVSPTLYLNDENDGEPELEYRPETEVVLDATDGCGMMLPSAAERWSEELGLDYTISGINTRYCWEKGMLFTFDFVDFAEKVAGTYYVKDAWGNTVDIRDVEIVLTTSMLKLWDSYASCDEYVRCCRENHYSFCVTKYCPKKLENERYLNYQFIQSFQMTDDDIEELIAPTIRLFKDVLGGDWRKTVLFLMGSGLDATVVDNIPDSIGKAIMIDPRVTSDPYVQGHIYSVLRNKINEAKTGVIKVHGNYSIASGDLYALCQSIFGLPVTGILKAGEIYNEYWNAVGSESLVCFRAPMSVHNNVRKVHLCSTPEASYWFRHIHTGTVFNSWDTATAALNGMDYDGDLVMLTDNAVLLRNHEELPALMCVQRKATKCVPSEKEIVRSNIESFGNEIGKITNRITSMYEVMAHFNSRSTEYKELSYRIKCGQLYQQNCIDKAKGIIAKPMPREWYDRHAISNMDNEDRRRLYQAIAAEKKPYFMRYIYPALMREYNDYVKKTNRNALREFGLTVSELEAIPYSMLSERQLEFLKYYNLKMPVGTGGCVMNKICKRFEDEFDTAAARKPSSSVFDHGIYKSGQEYSKSQFNRVKRLCTEYNRSLQDYRIYSFYDFISDEDTQTMMKNLDYLFIEDSLKICAPSQFCDILLDVCYSGNRSKAFVWNYCIHEIIQNLLQKNDGEISVLSLDPYGDIEFGGERFSITRTTTRGDYE